MLTRGSSFSVRETVLIGRGIVVSEAVRRTFSLSSKIVVKSRSKSTMSVKDI